MNLPNSTKFSKTPKGFTLIEMLIVLAIIAVVAVSLISFINPAKQFEKGNNAAIQTSMAKILTAIESYYGVKGEYPNCVQLTAELESEEIVIPPDCASSGGPPLTRFELPFIISGIEYPENCDADGYPVAGGTTPCFIRYEVDTDSDSFCLGVALHGTSAYTLFQRGGAGATAGWVTPSTTFCNLP